MFRLIACVVFMMAISGAVCAQTADDSAFTQERIDMVIGTLDSPDFGVREEGTRALSQLFHGQSHRLLEMVHERELSAEQRVRVLRVARELFTNRPRAAIGITMDNGRLAQKGWSGRGTRVLSTQKDFPVHLHGQILVGDVILRLGDVELPADRNVASRMLITEVTSREPGEKLHVTVLRAKSFDPANPPLTEDQMDDPVEVDTAITLGSWRDLRGMNGVSRRLRPEELEAAWRNRLKRAGVSLRGDQSLLVTKTSQGAWGHSLRKVVFPQSRFFVAADSQLATVLSLATGFEKDRVRMKRNFTVRRTDEKVNQLAVDAEEIEPFFEIDMVPNGRIPKQMRDQRLELLRLSSEVSVLQRDLLDRQRSAQERELIRARLEQLIVQHEAAARRFKELRAEIFNDGE